MITPLEARLRVGFIGAGPISEFHARALSRVHGVELTAVHDLDPARAEALAMKWRVPIVAATVNDVLTAVDVVHVLTPPASHADVAVAALEHGCHVYIEKPLATTVGDCDRIAAAAARSNRMVGVGHSLLRDPSVRRALDLVAAGTIGEVVSVEYVRSQPAPPYSGGPPPPYFCDGGYPFRDSGVHGLYVVEALLGPIAGVDVHVESRGRDALVYCDEWHVTARCLRGVARLHLSWAVRPWQSLLTVLGTRGIVRADLFANTVALRRARPLPEPVTRLVNSGSEAMQVLTQSAAAVVRVGTGRLRQYHGLQEMVAEFYADLRASRAPAVTLAEGRSAVRWTEAVAAHGDALKKAYLERFVKVPSASILVTGASGFIGRRLVERLVARGDRVRALVHRDAPAAWHHDPQIEVLQGDIGDPTAVDRAVAGATLIFHLAATMRGSVEDFDRGTVLGTQHVVESVLTHRVPRLVYMSSLSVLHAAATKASDVITESWPLEPRPNDRGHYTRTKLAAELYVRNAVRERGLPAVILRPGEVVGPESALLTSGVAQRAGRTLVVMGNGRLLMPLVAVDDVVTAMLTAAEHGPFDGTVVHLVDPLEISQNEMVARYRVATATDPRVVHMPRPLFALLGAVVETGFNILGRPAPLSRYRVASALAPRRFDCSRARALWGWEPRAGVRATLDQLVDTQKR